jgi:hypothetical protein
LIYVILRELPHPSTADNTHSTTLQLELGWIALKIGGAHAELHAAHGVIGTPALIALGESYAAEK